ncbi:hypothetical protein [Flaviaesturariibacter amylovorans]|uniref:Uncharacterized protein n=1 Tax=Flaviaesturariibacter amylovorans TaxID=1084520 RepID=A0ABP8GPK9_9BACT
MNYRLGGGGAVALIKIRVQNSKQNLSGADGFRLIVRCDTAANEVALLHMYPKRGKLGMLDMPSGEAKRLVKEYMSEKAAGKLVKHNFAQELAELV